MRKALLMVASAFVLGGCKSITDACTTVASEGISLEVRDSVSNALVRQDSTSSLLYRVNGGVVQSGVVIFPDHLVVFGSGTFDLTYNRPGYRTWTKSGIVVPVNNAQCPQPISQKIIARVVPQ